MTWENLTKIDQLNDIDESSNIEPIIIFKHSTTCPISSMAKSRLEKEYDLQFKTYYLDLLSFRSISNEIANRYDVEHQSPQILVIKNGRSIYDASHLFIRAANIELAANDMIID